MEGTKDHSHELSNDMCDMIWQREAVALIFEPNWQRFRQQCPGNYGAGRRHSVGEVHLVLLYLYFSIVRI